MDGMRVNQEFGINSNSETFSVENKQAGVLPSYVIQKEQVRSLRISCRSPDTGVHLLKTKQRCGIFEAKKSVVGGRFNGLGSSETQACRTVAS
jgi:hypothetical protein